MKKTLRTAGVLALFAGVANAADTTIKYEVSADGLNWSTSVNALPGTQIQVRTRVIWTGATPVYGLEQVIFQPIVSNWTLTDHLETTAGTPVNAQNALNPSGTGPGGVGPVGGGATNPSGNVPDEPGVWGRVTPFGVVATRTSDYLRGFLGTGTASGLLRIAKANISNWVGVGSTSGPLAVNNTNGGGGVVAGQFPPSGFRAGTPDFLPGTDVVVFKFGFTLGASSDNRTLGIDTPIAGISRQNNVNDPHYGSRVVYWAVSPDDTRITPFYDSIGTEAAFVNVVPAPGAAMVMLAGGVLASRRRR